MGHVQTDSSSPLRPVRTSGCVTTLISFQTSIFQFAISIFQKRETKLTLSTMQFLEDKAWKRVSTQKEDVETIVFVRWHFIGSGTMEKTTAIVYP